MEKLKNNPQFSGLTESEVKSRIARDGYNELQGGKSKSFWAIMFGVVKEPMFLLLVACGTIYMLLGDITEGFMLLGFVFVPAAIYCKAFWQVSLWQWLCCPKNFRWC